MTAKTHNKKFLTKQGFESAAIFSVVVPSYATLRSAAINLNISINQLTAFKTGETWEIFYIKNADKTRQFKDNAVL